MLPAPLSLSSLQLPSTLTTTFHHSPKPPPKGGAATQVSHLHRSTLLPFLTIFVAFLVFSFLNNEAQLLKTIVFQSFASRAALGLAVLL